MSTFIVVIIVVLILFFAFLSGWLAERIGRDNRIWFWISLPLPVVSLCILLCLPEKQGKLIVMDNADQFGHLFNEKDSTTILN